MIGNIPTDKVHTFTRDDSIKGGQSTSIKKSEGQKIRWAKHKALNNKDYKRINSILADPTCSLKNIMELTEFMRMQLEKAQEESNQYAIKQWEILMKRYEKLHELAHGTKSNIKHEGEIGYKLEIEIVRTDHVSEDED